MSSNKSYGQKLSEKLSYTNHNAWNKISEEDVKNTFSFCDEYKSFLDKSKTEREFINETQKLISKSGFVSIDEIINSNQKLKEGMKVYKINRNKSIILATIGSEPPEMGFNLLGAHVDSPRLDLKPNPLYESSNMAFLQTHYYGGIKKYQWVTIPLAIHGFVVKKDGSVVEIEIGEDENDAVFTITDLLPHLAKNQMQKKMMEGIKGEDLNILCGSIPFNDEKISKKVKLNILNLINEKYGIVEEDFQAAEIQFVPSNKAKDVGFDRGMLGAYGQDDRVCAYISLKALMDLKDNKKTSVCVLMDKEEIGSMGNTGAQSAFLENFIADICYLSSDKYTDIVTRRCISNSKMLSADVNAAFDPTYEAVYDKMNTSYAGKGVVLQKYTGARGKAGASDASAEFIGGIRKLFNDNQIIWQTAELGKVDHGGGGTIAQFIANMNMDVIDCGVAVLSMHSPFEVTSKADIYMAYKAYKLFLEKI
ncbi:aminopeptidase [Herbivorax sp. ANBcel31]|uniref:aminopeptidase n=1 Tax=Herbivorax sp. ANBcel31 TaxID=3069754 RepID=UPI0027AF45FC|nr:aminopeptidase [Herbivorax sp. ANBcel31]MDQ2085802.1 aminopeptidase [Herbivorax sp. ANBcel31]